MTDRNSGPIADGRNADGTFAPGNPGRPKGTRLKVTRTVEELLEGEAEKLSRKAIDLLWRATRQRCVFVWGALLHSGKTRRSISTSRSSPAQRKRLKRLRRFCAQSLKAP